MWKAITLIASTALFCFLGLLVQWNKTGDERTMGAIIGLVAGFIIGYVSIAVAVNSEKPK